MDDYEENYGNEFSKKKEKPLFSIMGFDISKNKAKMTGLGLLSLSLLSNSAYILDSGENGVVTRWGKYLETTNSGLNFKIPFIDDVTKIDVKKLRSQMVGTKYNREGVPNEALDINEAQMLTGDENIVELKTVVQYNVSDPVKFAFSARSPEKLLRDSLESAQRLVVGNNSIDSILTSGRDAMASNVKFNLQEIVDKYDLGINVVNVQFKYVNPPQGEVQEAFKDVQNAREEKITLINDAQSYSNQIIPQARAYAAEMINNAQAYSTRVQNLAQGETSRFTSVLTEYNKAPEITEKRMQIDALGKILPNIEQKFVVSKGDTFNLLNMQKNNKIIGGNN